MVVEKKFLMPDYYLKFRCKTGDCRNCCCEKWPVSFTLDDYFKLASLNCSENLRYKLDRGIAVELHPSVECYAKVKRDYFGNCPMRLTDGRCAVHAESGENALAKICRLYPRGIRSVPGYECSMANSCEGVLELLFSTDEPIEFVTQKITAEVEENYQRTFKFETFGKEQKLRLWFICIMQNRSKPISLRLMTLGLALKDVAKALKNKNEAELDRLTASEYRCDFTDLQLNESHLKYGLTVAEQLLSLLDETSDSVRVYGEKAFNYFKNAENSFEFYKSSKQKFENKIPKWEVWFEHALVNHMFFEQFPFQDRRETPWEEFVAICAVYAVLRFVSIGYVANEGDVTDFVDMVAAVFRLVDHTDFDRYASIALKNLNCDTPQKVFDLISL